MMTVALTPVLMLLTVGSVGAQDRGIGAGGRVSRPSPESQVPTNRAELEIFLDGLLAQEMDEHHIAGAAVSVVKDGQLLFAKGYGHADLENEVLVDPSETVFRIGSVTKLFAWTAVMQLVEQGKLDLAADINSYLDFHIPDTYPQPITLKHLMTHTAGFEDLYLDYVTLVPEDRLAPSEWMASHIPGRVRPPGESPAYSNYGAALAGYIVSRVSGQSYDQYIQEHILDPLGMAHSTALATLHPEVAARESVGYQMEDGAFQVFPKLFGPRVLAPMGFMGASATDMARFMIAHLQNGLYSDASIPKARILKESTARQMHTTLYAPDPRLLGTAYGFFDFSDNGQRTIGHSGTAEPMHSLLLLLPEQNLGVFVVYNSMDAEALINQHLGFQRAFFDHYYPAPPVDPIPAPADFAERAGRFVGTYRMTRSAYTTLEKFMVLLGAVNITIQDPGDGTLAMATPWGEWRFVEEAPLYFRKMDGTFHIVFAEDDQGHISRLFTDYTPQFGFEKLSWYDEPRFNMVLLLGCVLLFLATLLIALIRAIRSRSQGRERMPSPRGARVARWILLGICVLNLLFVIGALLWNNPRPAMGVSPFFQVVLGLGVLSAVLTAAALVATLASWWNRYWTIAARAYYSLVTVAAVALVWFLNNWNLLGWRF
jgi:CubicO group peptidase (beta-lactamase class C family)